MKYKDLARITEVLQAVETMTLEQCNDPTFIGTLRAKAFRAGLSIKWELDDTNIELINAAA